MSPARALAARVAERSDAAREEPVDAEASVGPATYFRDAPTVAEGMEQLRATLATVDGARAWPSLARLALALVLAAGLAIAGGRWLRHTGPARVVTSPADLLRAPVAELAPPRDLSPPRDLVLPRALPSPAPPPVENAPKHAAPARPESGRVRVQCTPWCVPLVDGARRGDGARVHLLELPAGKHRLGAQRLEDKQEREVDIQPRRQLSIDFTFQ